MKKKNTKHLVTMFLTVVVAFSCSIFGNIDVYSHSSKLNVVYDNCTPNLNGDGVDEMWYVLDAKSENNASNVNYSISTHLPTEKKIIEYYFEPTNENGISWTNYGLAPEKIDELKIAFANSMKKWNNVCFYSYDSEGNVIKNKVIEVKEGTLSSHNLSIYPISDQEYVAETLEDANYSTLIELADSYSHMHASRWIMHINIDSFNPDKPHISDINVNKARAGAHEIGHVLGLQDVDDLCSGENIDNLDDDHHNEIIMGGCLLQNNRATNISYKDIAGVAITRGFHTDGDHKWLNCGQQSDHNNNYKLLCSICNGVKYVSSLSGYTYSEYGSCNSNHHLGQGNMMAVASYGEADYYKCRYCKYVAPFSMIEYQDYSNASYYNATYHRYTNYVEGLEYNYLEEHNLDSDGYCTECDAHIEHEYGSYSYNTNSNHARTCACGHIQTQAHYIDRYSIVDGRYALCLGCNVLLDLENDYAQLQSLPGVKYSVNGSYLLPSGIALLVDEDMEAYLNGTLQFYNENDLPVTQ